MLRGESMGKIPEELLRKYVYPRIGIQRDDVIVGPMTGVDVALTSIKDNLVLVSHVDPIVGALKRIGWLAVHIACNDIATSGVRPRWIMPVIILPEEWEEEMLDEITRDIDHVAKELSVSIIGGHTGYGPGVKRPIVVVSAMGIGEKGRIITARGAKPGDKILITKGVGIEGTGILAHDFKDILQDRGIDSKMLLSAQRFLEDISVVREAITLAEKEVVDAMHDVTRGGVAEALIELANASNVRIEVWEEKMPIRRETLEFSMALNFDPLWMISSGTLILSVPPHKLEITESLLRELRIEYGVCGEVVPGKPGVIIHRRERVERISHPSPERDELARLWEEYPRVGS